MNQETPLKIIPRRLIWAFLVTSFIGLLDSGYLAIKHYTRTSPVCFIGENCDLVLTGPYAEIFGIPVALFGVFFYFIILSCSLIYFFFRMEKIIFILAVFPFFGFAASLRFLYLQAFVIGAFCQYCLISAGTSALLLIFSLLMINRMIKFKVKGRQSVNN